MKTLTLSLLLLAFTSIATAQSQYEKWPQYKTPEERAKIQTEQLAKKLNLNDTQKKEVYNVYFKTSEKYDQESVAGNNDFQNMNQLGNERDALMENILNEKQYLKYIKIR